MLPAPFIDFWFAGGRLVPGGLLVVDDTHLRACRVLADFPDRDLLVFLTFTTILVTLVGQGLTAPHSAAAARTLSNDGLSSAAVAAEAFTS